MQCMLYGCSMYVSQTRSCCLNGIVLFGSVLSLTQCACPLWCIPQLCPYAHFSWRSAAGSMHLRSTFVPCSHSIKVWKPTCTDGDVARHAGLILADSANMVMRISYSWHFIKSAVPGLRLTAWAPSFISCCAATAAAIALRKR